MRFWRVLTLACVLGLVCGCASSQLNYNTLELASTVANLQTSQVLTNLSLFMDNPAALPAHVDLSAGTASTTYSINPTITTPLSAASSTLNQVVDTVSKTPSTASEWQRTGSLAGASASATASDAWAQSWSYEPIIDGDELRRLRALYAYALGAIPDDIFKYDYPLVRKSQTLTYQGVKAVKGSPNKLVSLYCPDLGFRSPGTTDSQQVTQTDLMTKTAKTTTTTKANTQPADCSQVSIQTQIPDEQFLHEPSCIICMQDRYGVYQTNTALRINPKLSLDLHGGWLLDETAAGLPDVIFLGRFAHHNLYVRREDQWKLSEFTLFVLTATAQSSVGSASAASGTSPGGASQKKSAPAAVGAPAPVPTLPLGSPLFQ
jgi:hypothetical protein